MMLGSSIIFSALKRNIVSKTNKITFWIIASSEECSNDYSS